MKKKVINVLLLLFLIFSFLFHQEIKYMLRKLRLSHSWAKIIRIPFLELIFQQVERPVESVRHCRLLWY